jgi:hypothetical protein
MGSASRIGTGGTGCGGTAARASWTALACVSSCSVLVFFTYRVDVSSAWGLQWEKDE